MAYGDITDQVKQYAARCYSESQTLPKAREVLKALPHLAAHKPAVEKALGKLRADPSALRTPPQLEVSAPTFAKDWNGQLERINWYLNLLDDMVQRTGGIKIPARELADLMRLKREVESWIREDAKTKDELGAALPHMERILRKVKLVESRSKKKKTA